MVYENRFHRREKSIAGKPWKCRDVKVHWTQVISSVLNRDGKWKKWTVWRRKEIGLRRESVTLRENCPRKGEQFAVKVMNKNKSQ